MAYTDLLYTLREYNYVLMVMNPQGKQERRYEDLVFQN